MDLAVNNVRAAYDLLMSTYGLLIKQGVDKWSVLGHLEGALEDVLGCMWDIQSKCDKGECSLDH